MSSEQTNEITQPVKRTFLSESVIRESISKSIHLVLSSSHLNADNYNYIKNMEEKVQKGKRLTSNEVEGLAKIERALQHVAKGTYKAS